MIDVQDRQGFFKARSTGRCLRNKTSPPPHLKPRESSHVDCQCGNNDASKREIFSKVVGAFGVSGFIVVYSVDLAVVVVVAAAAVKLKR